jgi:hypothetical protein
MKKLWILLWIASTCALAQNISPVSDNGTYLPAALIDGRFFLKIPTINADTILGFCDTGGGYTAIYKSTLSRLQTGSAVKSAVIDGETTTYIPANELYKNEAIPYPQIPGYFSKYIDTPFFEVPDDTEDSRFFTSLVKHDAFLGQFFFINHAWTFDYLTGRMSIHTPVSKNPMDKNVQVIGFKKDKSGKKRFGHPSLKLTIEGDEIPFLFDTGATFFLNDNARATLGVNTKATAGSFISKSLFDVWHRRHPEWRIIEKGELTGADLIEVPQVRVGTLVAGPVWFAKRPDEAWTKGMIGSMDKVVKGAIGGSFLKYFKVTIDYNSELIRFEK